MEWVFWGSIAVILYSYFIYPLLLMSASALVQLWRDNSYIWRGENQRSVQHLVDDNLPAVTVVIAAYNEQSCIAQRVENILSQDYPADKLTLLVGSDGSKDRTAEILADIKDLRLKAHLFTENRGKVSVLNELLSLVETEITVLTDANTAFKPDTIRRLVRHFADPDVGAVCGELQLVDGQSGNNRDGVYWRYERLLKFHESRINALLGANGANYAIRQSLYTPLPANTIVDDYKIAMNIARLGYVLKYDPEAIATEDSAPTIKDEMGRRIRIGLGNYQACFSMPWMFSPKNGARLFSYISHKVMRWFVPHMMVTAAVSNVFLLDQPAYMLIFIMQVLFYSLAFYGYQKHKTGKLLSMPVSLVVFFVSMNYALAVGFKRYFSTNIQGNWQRTER